MQEQLVVWNDETELLKRAATPRIEWFPVPRHAAALKPLIWLLAAVPILVALLQTPWSEETAQWGLRSLRLLNVIDWSDFLDPGDPEPDGPLNMEPPLMTWVSAGTLYCLGPAHLASLLIPAILCVFSYVVVVYLLAYALGGAWLALLTSILVATHPLTQQLVHRPTSTTLGLLCSVISLWCFQRHLDGKTTTWSARLILSSLGLGICVLSSGPLSLVTVGIGILYVCTVPKCGTLPRRIIPLNRKADCTDWRSWKSLAIWIGLAMLIGGWWPLMMGSLHGVDFWSNWLGLLDDVPGGNAADDTIATWWERSKYWFRSTAAIMPLMSGFIFLGAYRMWRIVWKNQQPTQRRSQHFLMIWVTTAVLLWQLSLFGVPISFFSRATWTMFGLLPLSLLAAGGLLEIGERRAGFHTALIAYGVGVFVAVWRYRGLWLDVSKFWNQFALLAALSILFGTCFWLTFRFIFGNEFRQRGLVRGGIWGLFAIHCAWGVGLLPLNFESPPPSGQEPLLQFWADLRIWRSRQPPVSNMDRELYLITGSPSHRLQYVVQSVWPRRELKRITSWDAIPSRLPNSASRVIVTYGSQDLLLPNATAIKEPLNPIIVSRIYRDGELTAYEMH